METIQNTVFTPNLSQFASGDDTFGIYTKHAIQRMKQRGIAPFQVELVINFGHCEHCGSSSEKYYFDKKSRKRLKAYLRNNRNLYRMLEEYLDIFAVVADGRIITCSHITKHIHRH